MRGCRGLLCAVTVVGVTAGSGAAEWLPVFHGAPTSADALTETQHVIRQRLAVADLRQFAEARRRVRQGPPARLALNLWRDAKFDALIDRTARTSAGYSLSGRLVGVPQGTATLVVNGDVLVGTVWTPAGLYDVRTAEGLRVLREVDVASLPPLVPPLMRDYPVGGGRDGAAAQSGGDSDDGSVVDILVLWTERAAKRAGGVANIKALIDLGVAGANDAYARSGVHFRIGLAGAEQTDIPDLDVWDSSLELPGELSDAEQTAWQEELGEEWDEVLAVRDRVGADIISIVMEMGFGGFGNLMHELSPNFESLAYNFVHVDRIAYNTLAHEIGHNMGLHHDRFVNSEGAVYPYSHGYVNQRAFNPGASDDSCWVTIMAYLNQCGWGGHRLGVRIPYFSNPNMRYPAPGGDPLGIDESSTFTDSRGPANAVASLNKVRHVVANFRRSLGDSGGATDHGDTPSEATSVLVRSITRGMLEPEDVDYFRIDVPRTGTLRIETTGATDTHGELASADRNDDFGNARDDNGGEDVNFLIEKHVKAGTYYVSVRGTAGAEGLYRLQVSLDWPGQDDHGDAAEDATAVAVPSATEGMLGTDDVDYFRIDLGQAAMLRVETTGNVDTHGTLAWVDGRAVLEDDDSGADQNFRIETVLPAGVYTVAVRGFPAQPAALGHSHPATGFYALNVWFGPGGEEDDHGDAWGTATAASATSATAGELETALDVDTFRIELPALGTLRVQTTGETDTRGRLLREDVPRARLFRDAVDYEAVAHNDDGGAGANFLIEETLGSGTYLVEVRGFRGATTGGYRLESAFAPGVDDHGDTEETATPISLPSSNHGRLDARFDEDYFRVTLPEAGTLVVDISGTSFAIASLAHDERAVAQALLDRDGRVEAKKLAAGTYFVVVWDDVPFAEELGLDRSYRLDVSFIPSSPPDDHGDTYSGATVLRAPATIAGELEEHGDADIFRFDAPLGVVRVRTTGTTDTHGLLRCSGGSQENDDGNQDANFAIEMTVAAGPCYVRVRGGDDETTGSYVLEITFDPLPGDDHGDTPSAASPLAAGSATSGQLHRAGDADVFRIDVPEAGVLRAETIGDTDTVAQLAAEDGTLLAEDDNSGNLLNARIDRWVEAGAYFITIKGWRGATGKYALRLTFSSTATAANNHLVPLFLSAREAPLRQSFVRIVNRSAEAGTVSIRAIDDAGELHGPLALALGAGHAAHFNSHDLEAGNRDKGLSAGVGPGSGDWRLQLGTALDIEPLAYVRTQDGLLTAMHDVVPATGLRHRVPLFNPASNRQQTSQLRLINANAQDAEVTISAVDDSGAQAPGGTVTLTVPSGAARAISARQLEAGDAALRGRLGNGAGKWRLSVAASRPIVVMSLQTSPTGGMTNISTRPAPSSATGHALPLVLGGHRHAAQGLVRVVNELDATGEVVIHATSDSGARFGPLSLTLGAGRAAHFTSADLEQGNAAKGLSGSVGSGYGDWRLSFRSELPLEVLAYARPPEGPLATMHEVVPSAGQTHYVPFFNPASNRAQASELRLVNPGAEDADVTIAAIDDLGQPAPAGAVSVALAAQQSRTITAQQLEAGATDLAGRLGDGHGRWRLTISASAPIQVLNLLQSADGRLANLSTAPESPSD